MKPVAVRCVHQHGHPWSPAGRGQGGDVTAADALALLPVAPWIHPLRIHPLMMTPVAIE